MEGNTASQDWPVERSLAPARSTEKSETELKLIQKNIRYDNNDDNEVMGSTFVFYSSILFEKRQMKDCERLKNQKSSHLSCSLRLNALKNNGIAGLENPYYHNTVFTKTSHMIDKDKLILEMAIGTIQSKISLEAGYLKRRPYMIRDDLGANQNHHWR
ncbi:hypothetical protein F2Q70_00010801 [Brassica cretica]|uniref:Uncharacterized protein n=1 Tax=Brassica cretica TaxID=69181 RepID=A0A8S9M7E4_BRACR|nr:hypothetical protein F2Q70_00010801 [Brassica cretica]